MRHKWFSITKNNLYVYRNWLFILLDADYRASSRLTFDNINIPIGKLIEKNDIYNVHYHGNSIYSKVATFPGTILDSNFENLNVDEDESIATLELEYDNHMRLVFE